MFSFFKKKPPVVETPVAPVQVAPVQVAPVITPPAPVAVPPVPVTPPPTPAFVAPAPAPQPGVQSAPSPSRRYGTTSTFVPPPVVVAPPVASPIVAEQTLEKLGSGSQSRPPVLPTAPAVPTSAPIPHLAAPAVATEWISETAERPVLEAERKSSWMARLKAGLSKTSTNLSLLFVGAKIDEDLYEELEAALLMSDAGMDATQFLLDGLRRKVKDERLLDAAAVKGALKVLMIDLLRPLEKPLELGRHEPLVMMIAGVNGAGKTTTIGKLAKHMQKYQQSVLLAAGDTFRAAAREQLMVWGQRNNVTVIAQESGDPAAVAFDAVQSGKAKKMDVVMVDTAGRLPTQLHLMEELKKIKRVIGKGMDGAPHELVLVIDGNTGQNALAQVKAFDDALQLTGLVITKLDGTAKGGVLAAIARTRPVPVYFIGIGEKIEDLQPFKADEFVEALLG